VHSSFTGSPKTGQLLSKTGSSSAKIQIYKAGSGSGTGKQLLSKGSSRLKGANSLSLRKVASKNSSSRTLSPNDIRFEIQQCAAEKETLVSKKRRLEHGFPEDEIFSQFDGEGMFVDTREEGSIQSRIESLQKPLRKIRKKRKLYLSMATDLWEGK
jgi:hypothetical protein